jgi:hypothetical protein
MAHKPFARERLSGALNAVVAVGVEYLFRIPASAAAIPPGQVIVHNRVRPARRLGTRGFRAWLGSAERRARRLRLRVGARAETALQG